MTSRLWRALALVTAFTASSTEAAVIDTYETPGIAVSTGSPVNVSATGVPGAIGGERVISAGNGLADAPMTLEITGGSLLFTQTGGLQASGGVGWHTVFQPEYSPLENFDLTEGGTKHAFSFDVLSQSIDGYVMIHVESACRFLDCYGASRAVIPVSGPGRYEVAFDSFSVAQSYPGPAYFKYMDVLGFSFFSQYGGPPGSIEFGPLSTVPEPTVLTLLVGGLLVALARR